MNLSDPGIRAPDIEQPWQLRERASQLAALMIIMAGDEFECFDEKIQGSIRMLSSELAQDVCKILRKIEAQIV